MSIHVPHHCRHFKEDFEQAIVQLSEPLIDASLELYKWGRQHNTTHYFSVTTIRVVIYVF